MNRPVHGQNKHAQYGKSHVSAGKSHNSEKYQLSESETVYNARKTALQILTACRRNGAWADEALRTRLEKYPLSAADAALCSRIVYGVIQNSILLEYYLNYFCTRKIETLQPPLGEILRMGAYQILFLDRIPDHAAVHESVELAKSSGCEKASGLVNAVLRKLSANRNALPVLPDGLQGMSIRWSMPLWLTERIVNLLGVSEAEKFFAACNKIPPVTVQANTLRTSAGALCGKLNATGIQADAHAWVPDCLELRGTGSITALETFRNGEFFVQDPAARLVTLLAGIQPGQSVLDVCAAPGGKTFSAAIAMKNQGTVISCDIKGKKLQTVREGLSRLGLSCVKTIRSDGREFHSEWTEQFDTVLTDVPCSGLGILRKKPDIRYRKETDFAALPELQSAILNNAAGYVRPGGTLVYSTCTILPEENQQIIETFLREHSNFHLGQFILPEFYPGQAVLSENIRKTGDITLWPHRHQTDGFYISILSRIS